MLTTCSVCNIRGAGQMWQMCPTFSMLYLMFVMQENWTPNTALTWANWEIQMNPGWQRQSEVLLQVAQPVWGSSEDPDCPFLPPAAEFLKTFLHKLGTKRAPVPDYSKNPFTLYSETLLFLNSCSAALLERLILKIFKLLLVCLTKILFFLNEQDRSKQHDCYQAHCC